jgi:hypothetical protein
MIPGDFSNLEVSLNPKNPKLQLLLDNSNVKMSIKDSLCKNKHAGNKLEEVLSEDMIYYYERKLRKLYDDDELHSLIISLMITLLITPNSGVLDPTYCSQHPVSKLWLNDSRRYFQLLAHLALPLEPQVEQTLGAIDLGEDQ